MLGDTHSQVTLLVSASFVREDDFLDFDFLDLNLFMKPVSTGEPSTGLICGLDLSCSVV
jgi:hypothetical protein